MREYIIAEIKRLAEHQRGVPPGQAAFAKSTGISTAKWRGIYWLKWSDALAEAGFQPNPWQKKHSSDEILLKLAELTQRLGRLPTNSEIKFERKQDPSFPVHSTIANHFPTKVSMSLALISLADRDPAWITLNDIVAAPGTQILPTECRCPLIPGQFLTG